MTWVSRLKLSVHGVYAEADEPGGYLLRIVAIMTKMNGTAVEKSSNALRECVMI